MNFLYTLSHWSVVFQMVVVFILFLFFFVGWIVTRRKILRSWAAGWLSDFLALLSVLLAVGGHEANRYVKALYLNYAFFKFLYIFFLLLGLYQFNEGYSPRRVKACSLTVLIVAFLGASYSFFNLTAVHIQVMVFFATGLIALAGGLHGCRIAFRARTFPSIFISVIFLLYGLFFLHHTFAVVPYLFGGDLPFYMDRISFLDAGAELAMGLSIFLATILNTLSELKNLISQLQDSREKLRRLADVDPLTGLYNRRKLRNFVNSLEEKEGVVVFIDINNFKKINDLWGHLTGDRCLRRIADKIRDFFREEDGVFRYGGDEFLIVVSGTDEETVRERMESFERELKNPEGDFIPLVISYGISRFGKDIPFSRALQLADEQMYRHKDKTGGKTSG